MDFTNEERLAIYELAKKEYSKDKAKPQYGMCFFISNAILDLQFINVRYQTLYDALEELREICPFQTYINKYWWNVKDSKIRIKMFNKMIKSVKSKINGVR